MHDIIVIGAGIQGMMLTHKLCALNSDVRILNIEKNLNTNHTGQTFKSQFYIHRGHFYKEKSLILKLNNTYNNWIKVIHDLNISTFADSSFIGFTNSGDEWIQYWNDLEIPFNKSSIEDFCNKFLNIKIKELYTFPHVLINGMELMDKLYKRNMANTICDNIHDIVYHNDYYTVHGYNKSFKAKKIVICAGEGTDLLIEKLRTVHKNAVEIQKRFCQVLSLKGYLPNLSLLIPDEKLFIASQCENDNIPAWLCTYDDDPIIGNTQHEETIHWNRLENQIMHLRKIFPNLFEKVKDMKMYTAKKIESKMLGNGKRPNDVFVESIADNALVCLPTKLTLALDAADTIINKLAIH
ncbi:MAG: FAD-dependent oxidoreductase [Burkholderiales bacterium]|nr:FAD-dependent oxidoreductase [Burkholderiales bacterium]